MANLLMVGGTHPSDFIVFLWRPGHRNGDAVFTDPKDQQTFFHEPFVEFLSVHLPTFLAAADFFLIRVGITSSMALSTQGMPARRIFMYSRWYARLAS
jgi:hypothetical protein